MGKDLKGKELGKGLSQDLSYRTLWEPASIRQAEAACREKGESSSETVSYTRSVMSMDSGFCSIVSMRKSRLKSF